MTLEKQLVSLELSKKLKELGVEQESLWSWHCPSADIRDGRGELVWWEDYQEGAWSHLFSAFTVAELGEMLPMEQFLPEDYKFETFKLPKGKWVVEYNKYNNGRKTEAMQMGDTEADARAKMLIYLLENNPLKK